MSTSEPIGAELPAVQILERRRERLDPELSVPQVEQLLGARLSVTDHADAGSMTLRDWLARYAPDQQNPRIADWQLSIERSADGELLAVWASAAPFRWSDLRDGMRAELQYVQGRWTSIGKQTRDRIGVVLLALLIALLMVITSNSHGPDLNWDLLNYHWYNGFAWWHERYQIDFLPAQLQSFMNPVFDIVLYLAASNWAPRTVSHALAVTQGLNLLLVFFIARHLLARPAVPQPFLMPALIALVCATGATFRAQVGNTMGDIVVSLPLLLCLLGILTRPELRGASLSAGLRWAALLGACAGLAAGIKLTALLPVVALGLAVATLNIDRPRRALLQFVCFGTAAMLCWLLLSGWWMLGLYQEWQSPLFPYLNQWFQSPHAAIDSHKDPRFVADGLGAALTLPARWINDPSLVSELPFFDIRLSLGLLASLILLFGWRRRPPTVRALLVFVLATYLSWALMFGIYRYAAPLELLAPVLILLCIPKSRWQPLVGGIAAAALLLLAAITEPPKWGRDRNFDEQWFAIEWPAAMPKPDDLVLIGGQAPLSFLVPEMPGRPATIRLQGNLLNVQNPADPLGRIALQRAHEHGGRPWLMFNAQDLPFVEELRGAIDLHWDDADCEKIGLSDRGHVPRDVRLCPARWQPDGEAETSAPSASAEL